MQTILWDLGLNVGGDPPLHGQNLTCRVFTGTPKLGLHDYDMLVLGSLIWAPA